jgi:transposase
MWKSTVSTMRLIDEQIDQLDQEMANLLSQYQDAVERLAEVPGLGVDSAQQIIAEVGPTAATFPSAKCLSSWVGACPGDEESAGVNYSHRSPHGNRHMRRLCKGFRETVQKNVSAYRWGKERITSSPDVLSGEPVFRGTRIPLEHVAANKFAPNRGCRRVP